MESLAKLATKPVQFLDLPKVLDQPDISLLPQGVPIPTGQRTSETQSMTSEHLQDHMRRYEADTWLTSPEYSETIYRLLNHTIDELKADKQFIPAWRRFKQKAAVC